MKFFTYVVNWDEVYANVLNIENEFINNNVPHKIINSGSANHEHWMNVGDIRFYRQLYTAVKDFDRSYEYMFWLCGDVKYNNWTGFINRANSIASTYDFWAYAPHLTNEPWHADSSKMKQLDNDILISIQTDGIAVILHKDIVNMLEKYFDYLSNKVDITTLTSGWGMDMIWCSYAIYNKKVILRDNRHILDHPAGSSYNHDKASKELKIILNEFYEFSKENNMNQNVMGEIHNKIYGRMSHDPSCMNLESFYNEHPKIIKSNNIDYHIIYINDERKENRDNIDFILNGNKLQINSLNAKEEGSIEKFKLDNTDFKISWDGFKSGEFGNFASHYLAWKHVSENNLDSLLIFEDDSIINLSFMDKYNLFLKECPKDYDIFSIFVHENQFPRFNTNDIINDYIAKGYQDWSTLCYVISNSGAKKLLDYVKNTGMDHPTDWFIFRKGHAGIFKVYTFRPEHAGGIYIDDRYQSQVQ